MNRIRKIETYLISTEVAGACADATRKVDKIGFLIVRATTEEGLEGIGITYNEIGGDATKQLIDTSIAPRVIGKDPFCTEDIWNDLFQYLRGVGRKGLSFCAMSAVDIALWDLKGKITGLPLNRMFGSTVRERIPVYASGGWTSYSDEVSLSQYTQPSAAPALTSDRPGPPQSFPSKTLPCLFPATFQTALSSNGRPAGRPRPPCRRRPRRRPIRRTRQRAILPQQRCPHLLPCSPDW